VDQFHGAQVDQFQTARISRAYSEARRAPLNRGNSTFDKVPLHVVSRWMGHSKVELTSKQYGDFAPDNLEQWTYLPTAN